MGQGRRTAAYDDRLHIEAYRFEGILQPFPNHFHEHYVIGYMEAGARSLSCKNREYAIAAGDILLFNPGDSHACIQSGDGAMGYLGLNISPGVMLDLAEKAAGRRELPVFSCPVIRDEAAAGCLRLFHGQVMEGSDEIGKEGQLLQLISLLFRKYGRPPKSSIPECREEIAKACGFIEQHYSERIDLEQICRYTGLSKSTLLRAFVRSKGVTPYGYLESIRIDKAKRLLERGILPIEAALQTGFSDQSHFTHYFNRLIGLTPGIYRNIFKAMGEAPHTAPM